MFFKNLALIGPPGSGKGSYGRHLAKALNISLLTMSDLLRKQVPDVSLGDGKLVDDSIVSRALLQSLQDDPQQNGYLLDGFPRTIDQIYIMKETFPKELQLEAVLQLDVPDRVCKTKLLGRRFCRLCETNFSINGVDFDEFYLPPSQPQKCHQPCHPNQTLGDTGGRYRGDYPGAAEGLTPYNGYDDIPFILARVESWLQGKRASSNSTR
eukprot:scaffold5966_cov118-Cylindrotheca_fusiformis.AAC.13